MAFYRGDLIPWLRGDLLVAGGQPSSIARIRLGGNDSVQAPVIEPLVENASGSIRALTVSAEGSIYFCVNDRLVRLVP